MLVSLIKVLLQWSRLLRNHSCLWRLKIAKGNIKRKKKRHFEQISPFTCFSLGIFAENKRKQITQIHFQWVQHAIVMFPPFGINLYKGAELKFCSKLKTKALVFRDILFSYSCTQNVVGTLHRTSLDVVSSPLYCRYLSFCRIIQKRSFFWKAILKDQYNIKMLPLFLTWTVPLYAKSPAYLKKKTLAIINL